MAHEFPVDSLESLQSNFQTQPSKKVFRRLHPGTPNLFWQGQGELNYYPFIESNIIILKLVIKMFGHLQAKKLSQ